MCCLLYIFFRWDNINFLVYKIIIWVKNCKNILYFWPLDLRITFLKKLSEENKKKKENWEKINNDHGPAFPPSPKIDTSESEVWIFIYLFPIPNLLIIPIRLLRFFNEIITVFFCANSWFIKLLYREKITKIYYIFDH